MLLGRLSVEMVLLESISVYLSPYLSQFIAFGLTVLGGIAAYYLRPKVNLLWGRENNSYNRIFNRNSSGESVTIDVYCDKLYVQNTGRKVAEKVEISLSEIRSEVSIFPPGNYNKKLNPNGVMILEIPYIAAKQLLIVDTININTPGKEIISVKITDGVGKKVNFFVVRKYRAWVYWLIAALILAGIYYIVLFSISLLGVI